MLRIKPNNITPLVQRGELELSRYEDIKTGELFLLMSGQDKDAFLSPRAVLASEFKISNECNVPGVLKGKKLYEMTDGPALMMENFEGMPLAYFIKHLSENPKLLLTAVMSILDTVHDIHKAGIIHRGLDCKSILLTRPEGELQQHSAITFMGLSCIKIGEGAYHGLNINDYHHFLSPEYMSPEITGLVDTEGDHRADLYSLGVIFYEILTGSPPFRSRNQREIMNWHVSRKAVPPREINGTVPPVLSDMVMILLEKDPADRYENAEALADDIKNCIKNLREDGSIKKFSISSVRVLPDIGVSEEIAGRELEKEILITELCRAEQGGSSAVFISGEPGIGKTALVRDLGKKVFHCGGWFIQGKFDQTRGNTPYAVFAEALNSLIRLILMSTDSELQQWKKIISEAVGLHSGLLKGVVPDLGYIVEIKETEVQGDPQGRIVLLMQTVKKLLAAVTSFRRPLVIFLDDLQWADQASLKLLHFIMEGDGIHGLMLIGAYRDNEIDDSPILKDILKRIGTTDFTSLLIGPGPLKAEAIKDLLHFSIGKNIQYLDRLSALIQKKTGGNPLYVHKLLGFLNEKGLIYRETETSWKWDREKIRALPVTDNVVSFLVTVIDDLAEDEQRVLKAASCIKDQFSIELMVLVIGQTEKKLGAILRQLVGKDLLVLDDTFRYSFSHDRIKEASVSLLDDEGATGLHYKTGHALLALYGKDALYEYIFDIADHLYRSRCLIETEQEWGDLLDITLRAAAHAREITAHSASVKYYSQALEVLQNTVRANDRQFSYLVYKEYAESLFLNFQYDETVWAIDEAMSYSDAVFEKAELYSLLISSKVLEMKTEEAIEIGLGALEMLGMQLPEDIHNLARPLEDTRKKVRELLVSIAMQDLVDLPLCSDKRVKLLLKIINPLAAACFQMGLLELNILMIFNNILLTCEHGITPESVNGFVAYGFVAGPMWNEYDLAKKLGDASIALCTKYDYQYQMSIAAVQKAVFVDYWHQHLKYSDALLDRALEAGEKSGNLLFFLYATSHKVINRFALGTNIELSLSKTNDDLNIVKKLKYEQAIAEIDSYKMIYENLRGSRDHFFLEWATDETFIKTLSDKKFYTAIFIYYIHKSLVLFIYNDYEGSLREADALLKLKKNTILKTHYHYIDIIFLKSMSICSDFFNYSGSEAEEKLSQVKESQEQMRKWAFQTPDNVLFKYLLIDAEIARIENRVPLAMTLYDQAILAAYKSEYIQFEAIACERAAGFWFEQGKHEFAYIYLDRAYVCYREWGAVRKLELMEQAWPEHYSLVGGSNYFSDTEILALLTSFNALSGQVETNDLVNELADVVLLHSGAESFLFLAEQQSHGPILVRKKSGAAEKSEMELLPAEPDESRDDIALPLRLMRYMKRTDKDLLYYDDDFALQHAETLSLARNSPRSALCLRTPTARGEVIWYLENSLLEGAFKDVNTRVFEMIAQQALLCIENVLFRTGQNTGRGAGEFSFRYNNEIKVIPCENIIYCSSNGRHSVVHAAEGTFRLSLLLKEIEEKLPQDVFVRVHKRYIVNTSHIASVKRQKSGNHIIVLSDEDESQILIGRVYYDRLCERLKL